MSRHTYPESAGGWRKYKGNPVLGGMEMGACFDIVVMEGSGELRMYFSWRPKKSLVLCRSVDGVNWSAPEIILESDPTSGWEDDLNRNSILKKDGLWWSILDSNQ